MKNARKSEKLILKKDNLLSLKIYAEINLRRKSRITVRKCLIRDNKRFKIKMNDFLN